MLVGLETQILAIIVGFLLAISQPFLVAASHSPTASGLFFGLDDLFPAQKPTLFLSDEDASNNPDYIFLKQYLGRYPPWVLNEKPRSTSCLKGVYSAGFSSAQIMATDEQGNVLFSAWGEWDSEGRLTSAYQVFSEYPAGLKVKAPSSSARKWLETKESALSALGSGQMQVEPFWAPYALWSILADCAGSK